MKKPQKLIVAVLSMVHLLELKNSTNNRIEIAGGIEGMILRDVLEALGMEYELVNPPDKQHGRMKGTGSWTGIIGMTMRGESDLGCCGIIMTEKRKKAVDFSHPYAFEYLTFAIKKAEKMHLKNGFLYPFHLSVWVGYLIILSVMCSTLWLVLEKKYPIGRIAFEIFGIALRQPFVLGDNQWMAQFLKAILCLCVLVMTSAYSAILLSFLTVSAKGETIETLRQLSEVVTKGTHKCYEFGSAVVVPALLGSSEQHLRLLGKAISQNKWHLDIANKDAFNVLGPNTAIIAGKSLLRLFTYGTSEQQSQYTISEDDLGSAHISFAMNRKFCCRDKLNDILLRFEAAGMIHKYIRETSCKIYLSTLKTDEKVETNHKISVDDITGALLVLVTGYALSFAAFLAEMLFAKYSVHHFG